MSLGISITLAQKLWRCRMKNRRLREEVVALTETISDQQSVISWLLKRVSDRKYSENKKNADE